MNINYYTNNSGKNLILDYINSLSKEEVYFYKHNRIFYITVDKDNIDLLHACKKQKNKTEKKDKNIVIKRAKELGKMFNKRFI